MTRVTKLSGLALLARAGTEASRVAGLLGFPLVTTPNCSEVAGFDQGLT